MSINRISLAEQLKHISDVAPVDYDPEDVHLISSQLDFNSAAKEHYIDVGPSVIRKSQDTVSDPKYSTRSISRRQLVEGDRSDNDQSRDHSDDEDQEQDEHDTTLPRTERGSAATQAPAVAPSAESGDEHDPTSKIRKTRDEDRLKGLAVSRQIFLWDTLLDARIRLQKAFSLVNRLPVSTDLSELTTQPSGQESWEKMLAEAILLSEELSLLQEHLLRQSTDIQSPLRKRLKMEKTSDHTTTVSDATQSLVELESAYHSHLIRTLSKWSSKIQSVAPFVLLPSNRNAFSKNMRQEVKNTVQLIDDIVADKKEWEKLVERTRMWRGKGKRMGISIMQERDDEVFDDIDFYQQLLRDVIDSKNGEEGVQDWMMNQKERKKKKKADTKASKGRKLRFEVHDKLQNFMVPIPVDKGWHDEQIDELFSSLLGRGFETAIDLDPTPTMEVEHERGSFRVFG